MIKKVSSGFILTTVGLAWHGRMLKVKHFVGSLEGNDPLKLTCSKTLNNPINILLINSNIMLFSLNI